MYPYNSASSNKLPIEKINGRTYDFIFSDGYDSDGYVYMLGRCKYNGLNGEEQYNAIICHKNQLHDVIVGANCKIKDKSFEMTLHHNFWVKCSEYFAEHFLLEE